MYPLRAKTITFMTRVLGASLYEKTLAAVKYKKTCYSQFGEELHLSSYYDCLAHERNIHVRQGWIVDVGAFRPIIFSNTYLFHKKGWFCINIDPTPGMKSRFDAVRPSDINMEVAIASADSDAQFFLFGMPSVWNTMDEEAAARAQKATGIIPKVITIQKRRLETVLRDKLADPRAFEILTIDAEGFDLEILRSNNFDIYRPRIILIEVHGLSAAELTSCPVAEFLSGYGYSLHSWINPNLMFVRDDSRN
jgi:hypothetical protein